MLDVGQLVKDPYFTLFEAVGALEVSKLLSDDIAFIADYTDYGSQNG